MCEGGLATVFDVLCGHTPLSTGPLKTAAKERVIETQRSSLL
jgi:hypothetical protein